MSKVQHHLADGIATITLVDPPVQQRRFESDDAEEWLHAHLEKRKPNFSGR